MHNLNFSSEDDLKRIISEKNFNKIFVICGKKSFYNSGANKLINKLIRNGEFYIFHKSKSYPDYNELKKIIKSITNFKPNLIIAVGGGSVLDYAKIANVISYSKNLGNIISKSTFKIKEKKCPLIAIPTTAGSGAEVTSNAVIYVNKKKYSIEDKLIKPDFHLLLPKLIMSNSKKIKSSSGFDAIAQSLESLISKKSNLESVDYAKKSLKICLNNYLNFLSNPNEINSTNMLYGANLAGKAINISKTTAPHAVSYPFTSNFGISHGHAVSLTLEKFFKFNYINKKKSSTNFNLQKRFEIIFDITKSKDISSFCNYITKLKKKAGLEDNCKKLGINIEKEVSKISSNVNLQRLKNNPIKLNETDLINIILN